MNEAFQRRLEIEAEHRAYLARQEQVRRGRDARDAEYRRRLAVRDARRGEQRRRAGWTDAPAQPRVHFRARGKFDPDGRSES